MAVDPKTLKVGDVFKTPDGCNNTVQEIDLESEIISTRLTGNRNGETYLWEGFDEFWDDCELVSESVAGIGHPRFLALLDELRSMHLAKSADYGTTEDCYANYREAASLGLNPSMGIFLRMSDKWRRVKNWANGGTLKNEGVKDSLMDLAGYALAAITMIEEEAT